MEITEAREIIDSIDTELRSSFLRRMEISEEIAKYKFGKNLPILDPKRENEIIERECENIGDERLKNYYRRFLTAVLTLSKDRQRDFFAANNSEELFCTTTDSYSVYVGHGVFKKYISSFNLKRKVIVLTDSGVPEQYSRMVMDKVREFGGEPYLFVFENGEENKNFSVASSILEYMLKNGFTRFDCLVSVGGGVISDMGGFVASVFMRGIDFYLFPTTLLSMADASVGGKNALDFNGVKNVIGTFTNPRGVIADTDFLDTLPKRHISNGLSELIKIGAVLDSELFYEIDGNVCDSVLKRGISDKISVVCKDPNDYSFRHSLNFGHSIGHGIEVSSDFLHGEAVMLGMIAMSDGEVKKKIIEKAELCGLPVKGCFDIDKAISAVVHDKKAENGFIKCVLCPEIGKFETRELSIDQIEERMLSVHM